MVSIILCAGKGKRFESSKPKVLQKVGFNPLIYYSIKSFNDCEVTDSIYIVVSEGDIKYFEPIIKKYKKNFNKLKGIIIGGKERFDSVKNALQYLNENDKSEFVAIHDGARPFIKKGLIEKIYSSAKIYGCAAPGIKVVDTIKLISNNNIIENHLKRESLIAIQTPQIFNFNDIFNAYNTFLDKEFWTDDTEIFSRLGKEVKIVDGDRDLIKITYKEDLILAKNIYKRDKKIWR